MSAIAVSQASSPGSATTFTSGMSETARSGKLEGKSSSLAGILRSGSCSAVVAAGEENRGIGIDGDLPWRLPGDMKHFRTITTTAGGKAERCHHGKAHLGIDPEPFQAAAQAEYHPQQDDAA